MKFKLILLFVATLSLSNSHAQTKMAYSPLVVNYNSNQYGAGSQNWAISQDRTGILYFCNNSGLLSFDGTRWELTKLKNNLIVRSVYVDTDDRIYVGSFEEFGYFERDELGELQYTSLRPLVGDYKFTNDEIWQIRRHDGKIYFQTFGSYFVYDGKSVTGVRGSAAPLYFHQVDSRMYAQLINSGLAELNSEGKFSDIISRSSVGNADIVSMLPHGDNTLLITTTDAMYTLSDGIATRWSTEIDTRLKRAVANRATVLEDGKIVIGTINDGVFAIDGDGRELWHFNQNNGLTNNTVLGVFADKNSNVWVGLDNGIALIRTNSPIYFFEPSETDIGMIYGMTTDGDNCYFATNQGIFEWQAAKGALSAVAGSHEQNWSIGNLDGQIISGNNRGTFEIKGQQAILITGPEGGGNDIVKAVIHGKEILIQPSYTKLSVFDKQGSQWKFRNLIDGFSDLIMQLEVDSDGTIWAAHRVRGLYQMSLDESLRKVNALKFHKSIDSTDIANQVRVMKLRGRIIFTSGGKFYRYDDISNRIIGYDELNKQLAGLGDTHTIVPVNDELYWFIRNNEYLLVNASAGQYTVVSRFPFADFASPPIEDFGNIYVDTSDGVSYFCMNGVVGRYNPQNVSKTKNVGQLTIKSIEKYNRSEGASHKIPVKSGAEIAYGDNNVTFNLMYADFLNSSYTIQYRLDGFDNQWEVADVNLTKNYTYLPAGSYIFKARVVDELGNEASSVELPFTVLTAWYNSVYAIIVYILFAALVAFIIVNTMTRVKMARRNKLYEAEQQLQHKLLLEQRQQILELEKDKLESDITHKSKELASATMSLIATNEFLEQLKEDVLTAKTSSVAEKKTINRIVGMINSKLTSQDEWGIYQNNFDLIHENFFQRLKERFAELTPTDLRLCALLRLNMPTKDIARMSGLTVRGVEAARYRLRKRLRLAEKDSLTEFLLSF